MKASNTSCCSSCTTHIQSSRYTSQNKRQATYVYFCLALSHHQQLTRIHTERNAPQENARSRALSYVL